MAKQGLGAAKHRILTRKRQKVLTNVMGENVFGLHRREQIAFLSFAAPWCSKARPGHSKTGPGCHFVEKGSKKERAKV